MDGCVNSEEGDKTYLSVTEEVVIEDVAVIEIQCGKMSYDRQTNAMDFEDIFLNSS